MASSIHICRFCLIKIGEEEKLENFQQSTNKCPSSDFFFLLCLGFGFLVAMGFGLRDSHLLGSHSYCLSHSMSQFFL
jgi:hypothetical protein